MQDHRGTTNSPHTPSKARPLLQRFLSSPVIAHSPPAAPTPTTKTTQTASNKRMSYQHQLSYQSISSSSSASSLSSLSSASHYPRQRYSPIQMASPQKDVSRSEMLLRSTLLRDERSSSPQPQASSSRIPLPSTSTSSTASSNKPGHRRRHSYAVAPQSTRFGFGSSRQGPVSASAAGGAEGEGDGNGDDASLYMRAKLMRRRSTNTGVPSGCPDDRSSTPRPRAFRQQSLNANPTLHSSSGATQNVYGGDAEVDPRADFLPAAPQTGIRRQGTTTSINTTTTSSSSRNSPTSSSTSPTKSVHSQHFTRHTKGRTTSPSPTNKTGSIISSPRIQPAPFPQTPSQRKRQSLPASYTSSPTPNMATLPPLPPLPNMQQLQAPPPTAFASTFPDSQMTSQEKDLRARLERVLEADKQAAKKARRASKKSRSPMKGNRVMREENGNSLRFINGDVYLTDEDSDDEVEEAQSTGKGASEENSSLEPAPGVRERKASMNEVRDEEGSCPWKNDASTSTSSSSLSLPATASAAPAPPQTFSPKINYTAHMRSRTEGSPQATRQPLPPSSPTPYAVNANKRPPSSPLVNPRTPRSQPPHLPASPRVGTTSLAGQPTTPRTAGFSPAPQGHGMGRTPSTRRPHAATFNLPGPSSAAVSPRARSASLAPSPRNQPVPLTQAGQRNANSMPNVLPSEEATHALAEDGSRKMMITPPPTPPGVRSVSRSRAGRRGESLARNSPLVYATTRSPRVPTTTTRRPENGRSGSSSTSSSSEYDEGCLDEGYIPPLSLHDNTEVHIASSPEASADPSRPSYFHDQGIPHSRRPPPLMQSALFEAASDEAPAPIPYSVPPRRPRFNARKASERLRATEGYISFASVEGLGCPPENDDEDGKKDEERGRKGWKGFVGLSWVFGGGPSAAEV